MTTDEATIEWNSTVFGVGKHKINLFPAIYRFECWGAEGGKGRAEGELMSVGGKGAFVSGILRLTKRKTFFLFVGGKGCDGSSQKFTNACGGWNGGG